MRVVFAMGSVLLASLGVQAAQAQTNSSFRGVYVEAQGGGNRFQSQGIHDDKLSYGAAAGFDGVIADRWVVGPQVGWWENRGTNRTTVTGGTLSDRSRRELSAGVRGGYLFTPKLLGYVGGGYANNVQRIAYTGVNNTGVGGFNNRVSTDGYYLTGGAEYSLTPMFYVGAGYRYANYDNHTINQRVFGSVGVRFK